MSWIYWMYFVSRCSASNPTPYDEMRPIFLNPVKDPTSDTESIPSPSTSPVLTRRHYGESITSLGKASILGRTPVLLLKFCSTLKAVVDMIFGIKQKQNDYNLLFYLGHFISFILCWVFVVVWAYFGPSNTPTLPSCGQMENRLRYLASIVLWNMFW